MNYKGIYVATTEANSGKSLVILGMMKTLLGKFPRVGYFKPIINTDATKDAHMDVVLQKFNLQVSYESSYGLTQEQAMFLKNKDREGEVLDIIIEKYKKIEDQCDFVLVEGSDFEGEAAIYEFDGNLEVSKNLGLPVVIVASGEGKTKTDLMNVLEAAYLNFSQKEVSVLGMICNKIQMQNLEIAQQGMRAFLPPTVFSYVVPMVESLSKPTIREIAAELGATVLYGENLLDNQIDSISIGAMQLRNYLIHLKENTLVVTPGDRADIILGALQANISNKYPNLSGIILTGGLLPEEPILDLIEGLSDLIPIISVQTNTFTTGNLIGNMRSKITHQSQGKLEMMDALFSQYIQIDPMLDQLVKIAPHGMTPRMFQYNLIKKVRGSKKHIVLPEGEDIRILKASASLINQDLVNLTLLGNKKNIKEIVLKNNIPLDIEKVRIIDPLPSPQFESYTQTFLELRKHKNVTYDFAKDCMTDVSYFGTMMIYNGHADGMVSGATHTTQHTIRPALQFIKTKPGINVVSSIFFMCLADRVVVFGDCAINPNPTAEELADIAISSADSAVEFGIEPKVAMLSYSSGESGKGAEVEKVRRATALVRELRPDILIEGPIQYDAAVDMGVAEKKMPGSKVAGKASVLIFPDLNTGNNTYKAVQRETGAVAIGPMLQGLNNPVNDLSRGCTVDDVFNTVIITAIQAQEIDAKTTVEKDSLQLAL